jgi:hypothetical protein
VSILPFNIPRFPSYREHSCHICGLTPGFSTGRPRFKTLAELSVHVEGLHGASITPFMHDNWRDLPAHQNRIGFCNVCKVCEVDCKSWEQRLEHTANHFTASFGKNPCTCLGMSNAIQIPELDMNMAPGLWGRARAWITKRARMW